MGRWEPDAAERLQHAGMTLFHERGYDHVTVAEIAEHAGLTKRTFFNHFVDKRELPFAGAAALEAEVVRVLEGANGELGPLATAVEALTQGGLSLSRYMTFAAARQDLIASSPDLQERNLVKLASLTAAVRRALVERGAPDRIAHLAAHLAMVVFTTAFDDWVDEPAADFRALMQRALSESRVAASDADRGPAAS